MSKQWKDYNPTPSNTGPKYQKGHRDTHVDHDHQTHRFKDDRELKSIGVDEGLEDWENSPFSEECSYLNDLQ